MHLQVNQLHEHPHQVVLVVIVIIGRVVGCDVVVSFGDVLLARHDHLAAVVEILLEVAGGVVVDRLARSLVIARMLSL